MDNSRDQISINTQNYNSASSSPAKKGKKRAQSATG